MKITRDTEDRYFALSANARGEHQTAYISVAKNGTNARFGFVAHAPLMSVFTELDREMLEAVLELLHMARHVLDAKALQQQVTEYAA